MPFSILRRSIVVLLGGVAGVFCLAGRAEVPHIEKIERYGKHELLLHFATEANRAYEVQYTFKLVRTNISGINSNNPAAGGWTNLYTVPSYPFPNHFIIVDTITNAARYYRMRVRP